MRFFQYLLVLMAALALASCAKKPPEPGDIGVTSTDYFRYEFHSNYYLNPKPYFTLYLFPDGERLAVGSFYKAGGGKSFAFRYEGAANQLAEIKTILEQHDFEMIDTYALTGGMHTNHMPTYAVQIVYGETRHEVVWETGYSNRKARAQAMEPIIEALEAYLNIPQVIDQFKKERAEYESR